MLGKAQSWNVRIDDSRLARAFVTIQLTPDSPAARHPASKSLENDLRDMCRTWTRPFARQRLPRCTAKPRPLGLLRRYGDAFPENYREAIAARARRQLDMR